LYDKVLDWENHDWSYAFIKVSEGTIEDRMFKLQWTAARGYVYRGGYHFFRPLVPWKWAADKFLQLLDREGHGELPPVLDLEAINGVSNTKVNEYGLEWTHYVHKRLGVRPIIYTSPNFSYTIQMYRYPDWADYPLWQATYPWDKLDANWTETMRRQVLHDIISGVYQYRFPVSARPWEDTGRRASFVQFTGKMPPEYVSGYPLGEKKAVDVNVYRGTLQDLIFQFDLPPLGTRNGEEPPMSTKPITWTAQLKPGQTMRIRSGPSTNDAIKEAITAPATVALEIKGTGAKLGPNTDYFWGEVVTVNGVAKTGFIAFTTSLDNVVWLDTPIPPIPPVEKRAVGSRIFYNDGSHDDIGTVPA